MMKRFLPLLILTGLLFGQVDIEWSKTYGEELTERGRFVQQTNDGGFAILGWKENYQGITDAWLIKTNGIGDTLWTKTYGGLNNVQAYAVKQTVDGGYIIIGTKYYDSQDLWLIKTNENGDSLWSKTYGGESTEQGRSVIETDDGGFLLFGSTRSYTDSYRNFWLIKTSSNGDSLWSKTYGGSDVDAGYYLIKSSDSGYLLVGTTASYGNGGTIYGTDIWLIKINEDGDSLWSQTYGGGGDEYCKYIYQDDDGGITIIANTESYGNGENDIWLIKADSNGDSLWSKTYGGINDEFSSSIIDIGGSGYLIVGQTLSTGNGSSDLWLIQIDENGDSLWSKTYGGEGWDYPYHAEKTSDNGCIIVGGYDSDNDSPDIWSLKIAPITINNINQMDFPKEYVLNQNYPNPFNPITTLRYDLPENSYVNVTVYDILGREVRTLVKTTQDAGYRSVIWDATNDYGKPVSAGVYLYQIQAGGFVQTKKMVLLK
jgi:hypothetical protein